MLYLQSLGASTDTVKALGPLLEAGFTGREDKPQAMTEAFQDYWDLTYAQASVPQGGWPLPVMTCLKACGRLAATKLTPLPEPVAENIALPTLESAFSWSSSSTLGADEDDDGCDVTETPQDPDPFATPTKAAKPPSTPKTAFLTSSPQRPCKTTSILPDHMFSPLAPTRLDFVMGSAASSPSSTPSRLLRSPALRSPKKISDGSEDKENTPPRPAALPSLMEHIAMATASPATPKLGKRRASNDLTDSRPAKKGRRCVVGKLDNNGEDGDGDGDGDDSEAEREEVRRCLLQPVTPSPVGRATLATLSVTSLSHVSMPPAPPTSRSPSPTPQPVQRKRKHTGVFMEAVEVPRSQPQVVLRRSQRRTSSLLATKPATVATVASLSSSEALPPSAPLSTPPSLSASLVVRRAGLHRSQSLVISSEGPERSGTVSAAQRKRRQKKKGGAASHVVPAAAARAVTAACSSSPISASLKRARVVVGSGKSRSLPPFCDFRLNDALDHIIDDSMAAEIIDHDQAGGVALPPSESSDDDPHLRTVTPQHIFSPVLPRRLLSSSRFFAGHSKP
jgi:hypothetical protein